MNPLNIDSDDLVLFGSLALVALGVALVVEVVTAEAFLALGAALVVFGVPSALVALMASGQAK